MTWPMIVGFMVALGGLLTSQLLRVRASLRLTEAQRNQIITVGAYRGAVRTILVMGLGLWLLPAALLGLPIDSLIRWGIVLLPIPIAAWLHMSYFRKLRALGLPASYVRSHEHARYVVYGGCALGIMVNYLGAKTP